MNTYPNRLMYLIIVVLFLLPAGNGVAQQRSESIRSTASAVQLEKVASHEIQNLFPDFVEANIYAGGRHTKRPLNYNLLYDQFYFEDRRGNRALDNLALLDSIRIGEYLFGFVGGHGFFELVTVNDSGSLLRKHTLDITSDVVAVGAFGTTDRTASIDAMQSFVGVAEGELLDRKILLENSGGQEMRITLRRQEVYHVINDGIPVAVHSRRTLLREFSEHRSELRTFLRQNNIDFDRTEDMIKLTAFLGTLE